MPIIAHESSRKSFLSSNTQDFIEVERLSTLWRIRHDS